VQFVVIAAHPLDAAGTATVTLLRDHVVGVSDTGGDGRERMASQCSRRARPTRDRDRNARE
jgi:hypothetical protein